MYTTVDMRALQDRLDAITTPVAEEVAVEAFEKNMNMISEGTWALPADLDTANEVIRIMQQPIPLGDGGEDATNAISFAFGDDELFDDLGDAGDANPEGDARPIIKKWIESANFDEPYQGMLDIIKSEIYGPQAPTEEQTQVEEAPIENSNGDAELAELKDMLGRSGVMGFSA